MDAGLFFFFNKNQSVTTGLSAPEFTIVNPDDDILAHGPGSKSFFYPVLLAPKIKFSDFYLKKRIHHLAGKLNLNKNQGAFPLAHLQLSIQRI
ncbi:MAG: hypothetical protein KKD73_03680 [Proteobacteria bacterium]|nr:hypothetical protein [Pseudomonadota bacterium]MBU1639780.1 hypothetical protein [Pseudomonadota bacterium]